MGNKEQFIEHIDQGYATKGDFITVEVIFSPWTSRDIGQGKVLSCGDFFTGHQTCMSAIGNPGVTFSPDYHFVLVPLQTSARWLFHWSLVARVNERVRMSHVTSHMPVVNREAQWEFHISYARQIAWPNVRWFFTRSLVAVVAVPRLRKWFFTLQKSLAVFFGVRVIFS